MFKVESSAEAKEAGIWRITHVESGRVVAVIDTYHGFRRNIKQLKVHDRTICDVSNQKEALEQLEKFFSEIKSDLKTISETIMELKQDLLIVKHEQSMIAIRKEIDLMNKELERLQQYNLI